MCYSIWYGGKFGVEKHSEAFFLLHKTTAMIITIATVKKLTQPMAFGYLLEMGAGVPIFLPVTGGYRVLCKQK
jgi:hypothetical protein